MCISDVKVNTVVKHIAGEGGGESRRVNCISKKGGQERAHGEGDAQPSPQGEGGAMPPSGLGTPIVHTRRVVLRQSLNSSVPAFSLHGVRMLRDRKE